MIAARILLAISLSLPLLAQTPEENLQEVVAETLPAPATTPQGVQGLPKGLDEAQTAFLTKSLPYIQKVQGVIMSEEVQRPLHEMSQNINWKVLGLLQLAVLICFLVYRAWKFSQPMHWFRRFLTSIWSTLVYASIASIGIPSIVLGNSYIEFLKAIISGFQK